MQRSSPRSRGRVRGAQRLRGHAAVADDDERLRRHLCRRHARSHRHLALTFGGRWNYARIEIKNTGDPSLDALERRQRVLPLQSVGRPDLQAASGPVGLRRLLRSQPRADGIRDRLLGSGKPVHHRKRACVRSAAQAGRVQDLGSRTCAASMHELERHEHFDWSFGRVPRHQRGRHHPDRRQPAGPRLLRQRRRDAAAGHRGERSPIGRSDGWPTRTYSYVDATFQSTNIILIENNPHVDDRCATICRHQCRRRWRTRPAW